MLRKNTVNTRSATGLPMKVYVQRSVLKLPFTRAILKKLRGRVPIKIFGRLDQLFKPPWLPGGPDPLAAGKKILVLARQKGRWLKPCPGTSDYLCCGYWVLDVGLGCPFDCSYCFLQFYQNNPYLTVYTNLADLEKEIIKVIGGHPRAFSRIGSGEFTDSLALEKYVPLAERLIPIFLKTPNSLLELKTKSVNIKSLLKFSPAGRIVIGWSVNPPEIIRREEKGTPSLAARLAAAKKCQEQGYHLSFHFDPIIDYPGWERGYEEVVKKIAAAVPAGSIAWISLGSLRFAPALKKIVERRFPASRIMGGEFISGRDGKSRYPRPLRQKMYQHILGLIKKHLPGVFIYFCMESPEIWQKCLDLSPINNGQVCKYFNEII